MAEVTSRSPILSGVQQTFSALKHPNYRLWFAGQLVSLVGSWMQSTAQGYLIYQLTGSTQFLGYVSFASGFPTWLFTLYAGVVGDRISRRTMLIITQTTMMFLAFVMAMLVFTGAIQPWHIILLAFLAGVANAFDAPVRQSFVVELVEREDMANAIALNATMFNGAVVIGPAVGALVYDLVGPGWCFTLNAISFLAVIAALALMQILPMERPAHKNSAFQDMRDGFQFVKNSPAVSAVIVNIAFFSLFGFSVLTLIPAWAVKVLGGDVTTNGWLLSARGIGSLVAALMIAYFSHRQIKGKLWFIGNMTMPLLLLMFAVTNWLPFSLTLMVLIGWAFMMVTNSSNALIQDQVPDHLRSRVMGIYTLIFFGMNPIGSLIVGWLASAVGEQPTVLIYGAILLATSIMIAFRLPHVRKLP